jgi:hypothetical protein
VIILNRVITEVRRVAPRADCRDHGFSLITERLMAARIAVIKKVSMIMDDRWAPVPGSLANVVGPMPGASTLSSQERVGGK